MKKRWLLLLPIIAAPVIAYAVVPVVFVLAALNLHLAAGLVLDYMSRDVKPTTNAQPIRVYIKTNNDKPTNPAELSAPSGFTQPSPSQTKTRTVSGGTTSVTSGGQTVNGVSYPGGTLSGTPEQIIQQLQQLPQPPYLYQETSGGAGVSSRFSASGIAAATSGFVVQRKYGKTWLSKGTTLYVAGTTSTYGNANNGSYTLSDGLGPQTYEGPYVEIRWQYYSNGVGARWPLDGAQLSDCPTGYTANPTIVTQCDLTDVEAAKADLGTLADGKCVVEQGQSNPFDPDCASLRNVGAISQEAPSDGGAPVTLIKDPTNPDAGVTAVRPKPGGGTQVSQSKPGTDGAGGLQTAEVGPQGQVPGVTGTNYPGNPAPQYPGQTPGTGSGGTGTGSGGTGTSTQVGGGCGGANQSPCDVNVDPGDPVEKTPGTMSSEVSGALDGLKQKSIGTSSVCPANIFSFNMPLPSSVGGPMMVSDNGVFCDVMGQYQDLFRAVSIAAAWIMAMFIVLRA